MEKIKILVVDDEEAEKVKENVEDFTFRKGEQAVGCEIDTALTIAQATEKISGLKKKNQFYDIMIIDMVMEEGEEAGLEIFKMQLSCIKIVLTAHPSIPNCVKCLKAGAFDYIEKNALAYDPYEKLKKSMTRGLQKRLEIPYDPFMRWLNTNLDKFIEDYSGEHIAVIDYMVVDDDPDYDELLKRVKENYPFHVATIAPIPNKEDKECLTFY